MEIDLRLAGIEDCDAIFSVFTRAIDRMEQQGIFQWDEIYPDREQIKQDIENREMFVVGNFKEIYAVAVVNNKVDAEYNEGKWQGADDVYAVIHRICVNPKYQKRGIGEKTMRLVETMLREKGIESLRLDAFSENPYSIRLYEKLGFHKTGEVAFRKGIFYLYEKLLISEVDRF